MAKSRKSKRGQSAPSHPPRENDAELWQAFVENIEPSHAKKRVPDREIAAPTDSSPAKHAQPAIHPTAKSSEKTSSTRKQAASRPAPSVLAQSQKPQPTPIDPKNSRRIGKGRTAIDARIDLHGLRQSEAHAALRVFLFRSVAKGHRIVLVITGKGSASLSTDDHSRYGSYVNEGGIGRGVLRRSVPIWLSEPDLRAVVVGYSTAHIRHGGEGALYVQLRRNQR